MGDGTSLTVQIHHHGAWHDAAELAFSDVRAGSRSPTRLEYDPFYFIAFGNAELAAGRPVTDWRAVSVRDRVDVTFRPLKQAASEASYAATGTLGAPGPCPGPLCETALCRMTCAAATSRSSTHPHSQRCVRMQSVLAATAPHSGQV